MKYLISLLTMTMTLNSHALQLEGVREVQTPYWTLAAPEFGLFNLQPVQDYSQQCAEYQQRIERIQQFSFTDFSRSQIESTRNSPMKFDFPEDEYAEFILDEALDGGFMEQDFFVEKKTVHSHSIPFSGSNVSLITINPQSTTKYPLSFESTMNSLTQVSLDYGLAPAEIQIIANSRPMRFLIKQKDLACDLINRKVSIEGAVLMNVAHQDEANLAMSKFYFNDLLPSLQDAFAVTENLRMRSIFLGRHLGRMIDRQDWIDERDAETVLMALIDSFFDVEMKVKHPLTETSDGELRFSFEFDKGVKLPVVFKVGES